MNTHLNSLAHRAMIESIELRDKWDRELDGPIDVYALCKDMGVRVRFVPIASMEGLYGRTAAGNGIILLSSMRPLPRRNFTCGHELGHHVFGHGSTIDELVEEAGDRQAREFDPDEFLVDTFSGFLLMPTLGVRKAFASRGWRPATATPEQVFAVSCHFGVGYETLIAHMAFSLECVSRSRAEELKKVGPKAIRERILGESTVEPLIVADQHWALSTLDAEVGTLLLLPSHVEVEGSLLSQMRDLPTGRLYRATQPGIVRVAKPGCSWALFARIARKEFAGFAEYRHLQLEEGDTDE